MSVSLESTAAIYVALAVALSVWVGIFIYLWRIDAQARELRRRLDSTPERAATVAPTATLRAQHSKSQEPRGEARELSAEK